METRGTTAMEKWQNKIKTLRQFLRGWAKIQKTIIKKEEETSLNA